MRRVKILSTLVGAATFVPMAIAGDVAHTTASALGLEPDLWVALFTLALCLVTTALAIYTAKLYRATVKLGEEAKRSSADAMRIADAHMKSFQSSERAWLAVTGINHAPLENGKLGHEPFNGYLFYPRILNTGRTPAFHTKARCEIKIVATDAPIPTFGADHDAQKVAPIAPGVTVTGAYLPMKAETIEHLRKRVRRAFICVRMEYEDVFSIEGHPPHVTEYCVEVELNGERATPEGVREPNWLFSPTGPQNQAT